MIEEQELTTDEEYLKDLQDGLYDLISNCIESKGKIKDMDIWEVVHDLEFQLEIALETLRRYLAKIEEGKLEDGEIGEGE